MRDYVLGIDPGSAKCGFALIDVSITDFSKAVVARGIVATEQIAETVASLIGNHEGEITIAIGDGTNCKTVVDRVIERCPGILIVSVNEHGTSEEARRLVVSRTPPKGFEKLLPGGLRSPKEPYDDVVAEIIAQNFLVSKQKNL